MNKNNIYEIVANAIGSNVEEPRGYSDKEVAKLTRRSRQAEYMLERARNQLQMERSHRREKASLHLVKLMNAGFVSPEQIETIIEFIKLDDKMYMGVKHPDAYHYTLHFTDGTFATVIAVTRHSVSITSDNMFAVINRDGDIEHSEGIRGYEDGMHEWFRIHSEDLRKVYGIKKAE